MDREEFTSFINNFGADASQWPEYAREEGARLIARYPHLVQSELALNNLLDHYTVEDVDLGFVDDIVNRAATAGNEVFIVVFHHGWRKAAMLAACAVLGFWFGNRTLPASSSPIDEMVIEPSQINEMML